MTAHDGNSYLSFIPFKSDRKISDGCACLSGCVPSAAVNYANTAEAYKTTSLCRSQCRMCAIVHLVLCIHCRDR